MTCCISAACDASGMLLQRTHAGPCRETVQRRLRRTYLGRLCWGVLNDFGRSHCTISMPIADQIFC